MDLGEMEKRLRALEDLEAIKKLQRRSMRHHDRLEFTQVLDASPTTPRRVDGVRKRSQLKFTRALPSSPELYP
jgi:hypothetical protein